MAEITGGVHHINLSVSDLQRSNEWYQRLLGVSELTRLSAEDGSWSKVLLQHPSGLLLGLTQHQHNEALPFAEWHCGFDHVALAVADVGALREWEDRLDRIGVARSPIKTTPLGSLITIRDPDNIQLELYAPHPASE